MTLAELLQQEAQHRRAAKWLMLDTTVTADDGTEVHVRIKSFRFHNQILTVNGSINYASGHTINKVKDMQAFIRDTINNHKLARKPVEN